MRLKKKKIYFHEARSIGALFGDTLRYVRQHFGVLIRTLLFVGGPYVLASSVATLLYTNEVGEISLGLHGNDRALDYKMDSLFFYVVFYSIIYLARAFLSSTMAVHMIHQERLGHKQVPTQDITREVWAHSGKILLTALSVLSLLWVIVGFLSGMIYLVYQVSDPLGFLLLFLTVVAVAIFFFPYSYLNASLYMIIFRKGKYGYRGLGIAFKVLKGNFWQAWVVFFLSSLVLFGAIWLLGQPLEIYDQVMQEFASTEILNYERYGLVAVLVSLVGNFVTTLVDGFYYILCHFQYFSNEERRTGFGLKKRVMEIGSGQTYRDFEPSY